MNNLNSLSIRVRNRVSEMLGITSDRLYKLCYRMEIKGIGVSLIPGILTCNIGFRAGGSGK